MKRHAIAIGLMLAASGAVAQDREVQVTERTHGCRSPEETYRFYSYARSDKERAAKYSNEKGCRIFAQGEKVVVVDPLPTQKMTGVRSKDEKVVYYVPQLDAR